MVFSELLFPFPMCEDSKFHSNPYLLHHPYPWKTKFLLLDINHVLSMFHGPSCTMFQPYASRCAIFMTLLFFSICACLLRQSAGLALAGHLPSPSLVTCLPGNCRTCHSQGLWASEKRSILCVSIRYIQPLVGTIFPFLLSPTIEYDILPVFTFSGTKHLCILRKMKALHC